MTYDEANRLIERNESSNGSYPSTSNTKYDWGSHQMTDTYTSDYSSTVTTSAFSDFSAIPMSGYVIPAGLITAERKETRKSTGKILTEKTTCSRSGPVNNCSSVTTDETGATTGSSEDKGIVSGMSVINTPPNHPLAFASIVLEHPLSSSSMTISTNGKKSTSTSATRYNQIGRVVLSEYSYSYDGTSPQS